MSNYKRKVHKLDKTTGEILKTYNKLSDVALDGYSFQAVSLILNKKIVQKPKSKPGYIPKVHKGYGWKWDNIEYISERRQLLIDRKARALAKKKRKPQIIKKPKLLVVQYININGKRTKTFIDPTTL